MAKPSKLTIFLLFSLLAITFLPKSHASFARSISKEELGIKLDDEKQTHLTFYFHDTLSGPNPSAIPIAKAKSTDKSPTTFGALAMIDDPLTEGPEPSSKLVGRAQGMYGFADQEESALMMMMNFHFLEGEYNGSTLSVLGRDAMSDSVREMAVVGGTGTFRFAKGYVQLKTQKFDPKTGDAVVMFNVFVNHPSNSISRQSSDGSGSTASTTSSDAALTSKMVSLSSIMVSLLYFFIF